MKWLVKIVGLALLFVGFQTARAEWLKRDAGTLAWLHDVYFFNEDRGIIVGSGGTFLETRDGGKNWTRRRNFTADNILQIYFVDAQTGWLLCGRDPFNRADRALSYLMKTEDGGSTWERVEIEDLGRARLTKIFFNQKGKGFAVGESGAFFESNSEGNWEKTPSPIRYLLTGGAFFGVSAGAIVGASGNIYFTEDAGANWNRANVFAGGAPRLNSIFFIDSKNGWAVGAGGVILRSASGGKTWREQKSGLTTDLSGVFFRNTAEGWAAGSDGVILHTQTGGNLWVLEETRLKHQLEKILFVGKKGIAVGYGGTILINEGSRAENSIRKETGFAKTKLKKLPDST